jgi:RNA polymerase sigma factor (sigma-70 family)
MHMVKADSSWKDWLRGVLEQHESSLIKYAYRLTGDLDVARDIVQETFLRLCRQGPGSVEDHVTPWLFRVCRHRALDWMKTRSPGPYHEAFPDPPSHYRDPAAILERKEKLELILELLQTLPPNQREVITLKFQNDLSYKEISSITSLSVTNVGFLIHVGLKAIRKQLSVEAPPKEKLLRRVR